MVRVCFICLGNICRSPTAEGIFRRVLRDRGLEGAVAVESAGTGDWHVGKPPDARAAQEASERGVELSSVARQFEPEDFERFDYVIAMDEMNAADLAALAPTKRAREKIHLLRSFDPNAPPHAEVPDPYYDDSSRFQEVFDICRAACDGFLRHLESEHDLRR